MLLTNGNWLESLGHDPAVVGTNPLTASSWGLPGLPADPSTDPGMRVNTLANALTLPCMNHQINGRRGIFVSGGVWKGLKITCHSRTNVKTSRWKFPV